MSRDYSVDIVCPRLLPLYGGVERLVWEVSTRLVSRGVGVTIHYVGPGNSPSSTGTMPVVEHPRIGPYQLSTHLLKELSSSGSDLVYAHNYGSFSPIATYLTKRDGRPILVSPQYHGHGSSRVSDLLLKGYKPFGRMMMHCFDLVGYHSEPEMERLMTDFNLGEEVLRYLPPGTEIGEVTCPEENNGGGILYVGRLERYKNVDHLLRAFSRIADSLPERYTGANLTIIGEGSDEKRLRAISRQLDLDKRVQFLGGVTRSDLLDLYRKSDVVIVPSSFESFGMVIIEALAFETPVVCTRVGVARKLEEQGFLETLDLPLDEVALANAMKTTLETPRELREVRDYVRNNFSWERVVDRLMQVFNEMLEG